MKYKIIFADMDGTLLRSDKTISHATKVALDRYINAGGKLVLTSGRPPESILEVANKLGINYEGSYLICYNGAMVYDCSKQQLVQKAVISLSDVEIAEKEAGKLGIHIHTYENNKIVAHMPDPELEFYTTYVHMDITYQKDFAASLSEEPFKMIAIDLHDHQKLEQYQKQVQEKLNNRVQVLFSTPKYLEFLPLEAGKGNAITNLCQYLNIPLSDVIAIGDEENDISMIQAAGLGIAMKNGSERTRQSADCITSHTNDEDAFVFLIDQILNQE